MKKGIHPDYHELTATCHCGGAFLIGSTQKDIRVDICSQCHPVFSGKGDYVSVDKGLVDKFQKRYADTAKLKAEKDARELRKQEIAKLNDEIKSTKKTTVLGKTKV